MSEVLGSSLAEHRERTRTALFQALSELMSQHSFDKITLFGVANHTDAGHATVYNHFTDKEDLLLIFVEYEAGRYVEELSRVLASTRNPIDHLCIYVRQQALITRHFRFPTSGPLSGTVSRGAVGCLKAHRALVARVLSSILTDAMDQGFIPARKPEQIVSLIHATAMGGHPTPSDPEQRRACLESLDAFVLQTVGAHQPAHAMSIIVRSRATEPLKGA